jgi:hypothetical protein
LRLGKFCAKKVSSVFLACPLCPWVPGKPKLVGHSLDPPERKNQQLNWMAGKPMLKDSVTALWRIVPSNKMLRAGCELMASLSLA